MTQPPRKRARMLVFGGCYCFSSPTTQPPSKMRIHNRFRQWFIITTQPPLKMSAYARFGGGFHHQPPNNQFRHGKEVPEPLCHVDNSFQRDEGVSAPPGMLKWCSVPVENPCTNTAGVFIYF